VTCDELTRGTISESLVRVKLVVVRDPSWQLTHYGFGIWSRTDADIVALDRANEGFSHSVALWTFERRRPRFEPDVAGETAGVAGDVAADVVRKPFDRDGQAIDLAEPVIDGSHLARERELIDNILQLYSYRLLAQHGG